MSSVTPVVAIIGSLPLKEFYQEYSIYVDLLLSATRNEKRQLPEG